MTLEEVQAHMGGTPMAMVTQAIRERVKETMPGYLWIVTDPDDRKHRYTICERCGIHRTETKKGRAWANTYKQGNQIVSPCCGEFVTAKYLGRGYASMYDRLNVVWYMKSAVDPNAVVAAAAHCIRSFASCEGRPWTEDATIDPRSVSVIVYGQGSTRIKQHVAEWVLNGGTRHQIWTPGKIEWIPVKRFGWLTFGSTGKSIFQRGDPPATTIFEDTMAEAIAGTPFERAWSHHYLTDVPGEDGTRALTMIAKYPCIEYMTKLGMTALLTTKLIGELPDGLINWRGNSMEKVLRLDRQRLGELKHGKIPITPGLLALYRWTDENGTHMTARAVAALAEMCQRTAPVDRMGQALDNALVWIPEGRRLKALKYMVRQREKLQNLRLHLGDFRDYWRLCQRMGEDLNRDEVAFPGNILEAEARMRAREERDRKRGSPEIREAQDKLIADRYRKLDRKYGFSFGGLTLRPARNGDEIENEGNVLHHCVASYINKYAVGETVICVLRRDVDPERPWRTVEITATGGKLIQDRGYHNDTSLGIPMSPEYKAMLNLFWEAWRERNNDRRETA